MLELLVIVVVLFVYSSLRRHIENLSTKVDALSVRAVDAPAVQAVPQAKVPSPQPEPQSVAVEATSIILDTTGALRAEKSVAQSDITNAVEIPQAHEDLLTPHVPSRKPTGPTVLQKALVWVQIDWPMKVGGFLVILAVGWFVTYAADQGWISETGRVALGYLFGICVLSYGVVRAEKVALQGNVFIIIGVAAIFIATLAGVQFPRVQIPESLAITVMFITVGCVSYISLRQKKISLTGSMIAFGAIVPLFFYEGLRTETIFLYLLALTVGTLWIVYQTGWRDLTALMLVTVALYSVGHMFEMGSDTWVELLLSLVFAMIFYSANVGAIIATKRVTQADIFGAVGLGIMYLVWILAFSPQAYEVFFLVFGALVFVGASYLIYEKTTMTTPTAIYGVVAFALLITATSLQFDGPTLTIAYLVESAAIIVLAIYVLRDGVQDTRKKTLLIIGSLIPLMFLSSQIGRILAFIARREYGATRFGRQMTETVGDMLPHLFALFVAVLTFSAMAYAAQRYLTKKEDTLALSEFFATIASLVTLVFVWFATHLLIVPQDIATFVSLIIYTAVGVALYVIGSKERHKAFRIAGVILFVFVLARIFFVEFWEMDMLVRIITFFIIGGLFISTAFITHRMQANKH